MPDKARRTILDRADRMVRQSKTLRKVAAELLQESRDIRRASTHEAKRGSAKPHPRKK